MPADRSGNSMGNKRKLAFIMLLFIFALLFLIVRVFYIQAYEAEFLQMKAYEQHTRDRLIAPRRGQILDRNMTGIAVNESVASVSVIRSQIKDTEEVARVLSKELELDYQEVLDKTKKRVALERIMTKVDKETADRIRGYEIPGIVVDDDIKRVYPYESLAAQVIGFVGRDNQGIIGLEAKYDSKLKGKQGKILTETDARGIELDNGKVERLEPEPGYNLVTSLDVVIQRYAEQTIEKAVTAKSAKRGLIVVMDPQDGEILSIANYPTFDLNDPFTINDPELAAAWDTMSQEEQFDSLNQMWRNFALNDTYEPGSTFKIVTSAAGLEEGVVSEETQFVCNASKLVGGRSIRCWRSPRSHGPQNFVEGVRNSCNPVFMEVAENLGSERFHSYLQLFEVNKKTGVDLPGEASGIMYSLEKMGPVEMATMSFGQSLTVTPLELLRAASASINGGRLITPHVGTKLVDTDGNIIETIDPGEGTRIISEDTSRRMRDILESVVEVGTGNRTYIPGYRIGGKTATSEKLPRKNGKYISSFLAFAPAENPEIIALVLVDEPKGAYYGGQVTGPVMKELLENILPYAGIEPEYSDAELEMDGVPQVSVPDFLPLELKDAKKTAGTLNIVLETRGEGSKITGQFPSPGELINQGQKVILQMGE